MKRVKVLIDEGTNQSARISLMCSTIDYHKSTDEGVSTYASRTLEGDDYKRITEYLMSLPNESHGFFMGRESLIRIPESMVLELFKIPSPANA